MIRRQTPGSLNPPWGPRAVSPAFRRPVRARPGRACRRARPREPDWRAHRLQRRVRLPDRDSAAHARGVAARRDGRVRACSAEAHEACTSSNTRSARKPAAEDVDRLRARRDASSSPTRVRVRGFDLRITSDVPVGGGLSSSAALEIARAARPARRSSTSPWTTCGWRASAGAPRTSSWGRRSASWTRWPRPGGRAARALSRHGHAGVRAHAAARRRGAGGRRFGPSPRSRCRRVSGPARASASRVRAGSASGSCATWASGDQARARADCPRRSTGACATWSPRTRACRRRGGACRAGDLAALGRLMTPRTRRCATTTRSSVPAIDRLVSSAMARPGVFGARLTGGGLRRLHRRARPTRVRRRCRARRGSRGRAAATGSVRRRAGVTLLSPSLKETPPQYSAFCGSVAPSADSSSLA